MRIPFIGASPIRKNFAANLYGIGIQLINQILLVPIYIIFWGKDLYSDWIVISALTAFFSMSDIGLNNVIQNRFAMKYAEGNTKECNSLLTDNFILVTIIFLLLALLSIAFLVIFDITELMNIKALSRIEASVVFVLLICRVFFDMYRNVENAIYRAVHKASRSILMDQTTLLIVSLLILACVVAHISMPVMCLIIIVPSLLMLVYKYYDVKQFFNYKFNISHFDGKLLKEIFIPAISFMSFPVGNAIVLQGYTLVVNCFFGSSSVVLYNTTRTLCNFVKTFIGTIQSSVWPEYSIAYGNREYGRMRSIYKKTLSFTVILSLSIGIAILFSGQHIYRIWTNNQVLFDYNLMLVFQIGLFIESIWTSGSVALMSTNHHMKLSLVYLVSTIIAVSTAAILGKMGCPLFYVPGSLIILHVIMCVYTIPAGYKLGSGDELP